MDVNALTELAIELRQLNDVEQFWNRIADELKQFGVTSMMYGAAATRKEIEHQGFHPTSLVKSNHPDEYFTAKGEDDFLTNDITAEQVLCCADPVFWHDDQNISEATPEQIADWELSNALGLEVGVTISAMAFSPTHVGGVGLCSGELNGDEFNSVWWSHHRHIESILGLLDIGMRQKHLATMIGLTSREKEVLKWLTSGLRPDQIADRLAIGYRTVDKYIVSSKHKLNASTRDQAVVKALIFNAIKP